MGRLVLLDRMGQHCPALFFPLKNAKGAASPRRSVKWRERYRLNHKKTASTGSPEKRFYMAVG